MPSMPVLSTPVSLPAGPAQAGGSTSLTGNDVIRVLRENLIFIVLAFVLSGVAGYFLNEWLKDNYISYKAEGQLFVQPEQEFRPLGDDTAVRGLRQTNLEVLLQTQAAGLASPAVMTEIVNESETVRNSQWLNKVAKGAGGQFDSQKAAQELVESFSASPRRGSELINISFKADNPTDAHQLLNVIANTRIEQLDEQLGRRLDSEIDELERIVGNRREALNDLDRQIRQVRSDGAGAGDAANTLTTQRGLLNQALREQGEATKEALTLRQQLSTAEDAISRGADPAMVEAMVNQNPSIQRLEQRLEIDRQSLALQRDRLGDSHPVVSALRNQIDITQIELENARTDARAQARGNVISQLTGLVESAEDRLEEATVEVRRLNAELAQLENDAAELEKLNRDRQALAQTVNEMEIRLELLRRAAVAQPSKVLQWYQPVTPPTSPDFPRLPLTVAACLFVGVGSVVGLAFLREVLDTTVKSPRDVLRGNLAVLGTIPDESDDPEATDGDRPLAMSIAHSPHSMTAEQYRMVRSRLAHVAPLESTRSILVTSPQPGDGKTTVACNLAAGLALNGRSVLLVDANFRRPGIHKVFGLDNDVGFSTAMQDVEQFDDCVAAVESVPNLHVLTSGPKPEKATATELIENNGFLDVLDRAFEGYDIVVFDSGPILFTSETGALAPQVDGVISVVRARSSTRGLLGRLRDSLASLNVEHLGVVLNAVRSRAGGYYTRNIKTYYDYQKAAKK